MCPLVYFTFARGLALRFIFQVMGPAFDTLPLFVDGNVAGKSLFTYYCLGAQVCTEGLWHPDIILLSISIRLQLTITQFTY